MTTRELFIRQVKDALSNLYDPICLQVHPLQELLGPSHLRGETAGEALRKLLWEAVESLEPDHAIPPGRPEWLSYRLLWLHYIQLFDQASACRELGLGERTFYRRLQEAVEAVASILWDRYCGGQHQETSKSCPDNAPPMALARQEALKLAQGSCPSVVDLAAVLQSAQETLRSLAQERGICLCVDLPDDMPPACGDPAIFHQILLNVLFEGLDLAASERLELSVRVVGEGTIWRLTGLDAAHSLEAIRGLDGLGVSHELLQAYGGQLTVEHDGWGQPILSLSVPAARPTTVLIIDDDVDTRGLYRRSLQAHHYVVQEAHNAEQVEKTLREAPPDIILLDVLMPQQDGWKLLQRLKTRPDTADIPVVICSVLRQPRLALALGAAQVLQKPISEETLVRTLEQVLAGGS